MCRELVVVIAVVALVGSGSLAAAEDSLVVGTKPAPPFVMRDDAGEWSGIAIDLWRRAAAELGVEATYVEKDIPGLLAGLESGALDVVVAPLTVTSERERRVDFCHPFHTTGLGIAVASSDAAGWIAVVRGLFSAALAKVVGVLALVLLIAGALVWLFERRANPEQFGGPPAAGLGHSFWWAAVTMTTVGYGDKAPRTPGGRAVALVWMYASLVMISGLTAAIASALTVGTLDRAIDGPDDLRRVSIGAVAGTTSEDWAVDGHMDVTAYDTVDDALAALVRGDVRAVVHDEPILRYAAARLRGRPVDVLGETIERQDYAWAVPEGDALRESLNRVILDAITDPAWGDVVERHLGR